MLLWCCISSITGKKKKQMKNFRNKSSLSVQDCSKETRLLPYSCLPNACHPGLSTATCFSWRPPQASRMATFGAPSSAAQLGATSHVSRGCPAASHCSSAPCWPASCSGVSPRTQLSKRWTWVTPTLKAWRTGLLAVDMSCHCPRNAVQFQRSQDYPEVQ